MLNLFRHIPMGSVLLLCFGAIAPASALTIDLGDAAGYNVFVKEHFDNKSGIITGKVAAGGDVNLGYTQIGKEWAGDTVLVVGGDLTLPEWASGVVKGSTYVAGDTSKSNAPFSTHGYTTQNPVDFTSAFNQLSQLSTNLAGLPNTGSINNQYGGLSLVGSADNKLYVANHNIFEGAWGLDLGALDANDVLVLNIAGSSIDLANIGRNFFSSSNDFSLNNILFNFYEATDLTFKSGDYFGTFLAPNAAIDYQSVTIHGQVIANSWQGSGANVNFNSNILFPGYNYNEGGSTGNVNVPEAAAWMLALLGVISLWLLRRHRLSGGASPRAATTPSARPALA